MQNNKNKTKQMPKKILINLKVFNSKVKKIYFQHNLKLILVIFKMNNNNKIYNNSTIHLNEVMKVIEVLQNLAFQVKNKNSIYFIYG